MNSASSAARFRLPVQPPVRHLLIASMSALVGSIEVIAWAMFRLPEFVLAAGVALIAVGVGFAVAALVRYRSLRWVVHLGPPDLPSLTALVVARWLGRTSHRFGWSVAGCLSWPRTAVVSWSFLSIGQARPKRQPPRSSARLTSGCPPAHDVSATMIR